MTGKVYVLGVKRCAVCDDPIAGAMSVCRVCLDHAIRGQFDRMERDFPTNKVGHAGSSNPTTQVGDDDVSVVRSGIVYSVPKLPSVKKLTP